MNKNRHSPLSCHSRLKRIIAGRDAHVLVKNFTALGVLQISGYVFPLLTLPYLARVIGVGHFGEIAFASAVILYFQTIVDYGFMFSAVRDIARCRHNKQAVSVLYSRVMWSRLVLTLCSFALLCILLMVIPGLHGMRLILLLSFLSVPGHVLFPDWMFQALEKMTYITIFNLLVRIVFTIAVFIFIKEESDYILQPVLAAGGFLTSGIISMIVIRHMGIRLQKTGLRDVLHTIKGNTDLFLNQLAPNLYNSLSALLLGIFHHSTANGIFDVGNKFNTLASDLINIVSRTFFPFLSRRMDKHYVLVRINLTISLAIGGALFFMSPLLIRWLFTPDFEPAINVLRIMAVSLVFLSISNAYGTNYLIVEGYEKETRKITVMASFIGLMSAVPLVYYYSYIGAALAITASRGLIAGLSVLKVYKIKSSQMKYKKLF